MTEIKLDNFYHLEYSNYCLHHVSADASFSLLQAFHVELGGGTPYFEPWVDFSNSVNYGRIQVLSISNILCYLPGARIEPVTSR